MLKQEMDEQEVLAEADAYEAKLRARARRDATIALLVGLLFAGIGVWWIDWREALLYLVAWLVVTVAAAVARLLLTPRIRIR